MKFSVSWISLFAFLLAIIHNKKKILCEALKKYASRARYLKLAKTDLIDSVGFSMLGFCLC